MTGPAPGGNGHLIMGEAHKSIQALRSWINNTWMLNPEAFHINPVNTAHGIALEVEFDSQSTWCRGDLTELLPAEWQGFPIKVRKPHGVLSGGRVIG